MNNGVSWVRLRLRLRLCGCDCGIGIGIDYGVYGVPETYVIDKMGVIRHKQTGQRRHQDGDTPRLPKLQRSPRILVDEGFLDRRFRG